MTGYLEREVLRKRPHIRLEWVEACLADPVRVQVQPNGRIRHCRFVPELGRHLRLVTLEDGVAVHNAFPDRDFSEEPMP